MPLFELRTRETIEEVFLTSADTEDDAVARLNTHFIQPGAARIIKTDLIVQEISDKLALSPCA